MALGIFATAKMNPASRSAERFRFEGGAICMVRVRFAETLLFCGCIHFGRMLWCGRTLGTIPAGIDARKNRAEEKNLGEIVDSDQDHGGRTRHNHRGASTGQLEIE